MSESQLPGTSLDRAEEEKMNKHARRVLIGAGGDFRPLVVSVYGTPAFQSHRTLYACAEKLVGEGGSKNPEFGRTLHLLRARVQAAVLDAVSLCLVARRGKEKDADDKATAKLREELDGAWVPWEAIVADCSAQGGHE